MPRPPRVSIGIPVYNGMNYLAAALDCWLAQSYCDFEIIISDNASTDDTPALVADYAMRDARIRYHRLESNIGLTQNFNRVLTLARGEYFTWAAHDDLRTPDYLERCVRVLDAEPEVLVCHGQSACIDALGQFLPARLRTQFTTCASQLLSAERNARRTAELLSDRPAQRLAGVLMHTTMCDEFYGLIRTQPLRAAGRLLPFFGSDMVLLADLSLRGKIRVLPETIFFSRSHAEQATLFEGEPEQAALAQQPESASARQSKSTATRPVKHCLSVPRKVRYPWELFRLLFQSPLEWRERAAGLAVLARFGMQPGKWINVCRDLRAAWPWWPAARTS